MTANRRTQPGTRPQTPAHAWQVLRAGNARFMADERAHPHQDVHARNRLITHQEPYAIFFGCADSRVAVEIIFDQGLGDLFVVRTAGHVIDPSVLGSLEFGVAVLGCPLIVVLGHDSCGAVKATVDAVTSGHMPGGYLRDIVERVAPSVMTARDAELIPPIDLVEKEHIRNTVSLLAERSTAIAGRIADGRLGIVGAQYELSDGRIELVSHLGEIDVVDGSMADE